jgi:hypothetical protein
VATLGEVDEFSAKLAWEEYKLLQDKLDKLGDFRFRVKSWTVTVGSGLIAADAVGKVSDLTCLLTLVVSQRLALSKRSKTRLTSIVRFHRRKRRCGDLDTKGCI